MNSLFKSNVFSLTRSPGFRELDAQLPLRWLCCTLAFCFLSLPDRSAFSADLTGAQMLALLKANDAQLQNALIEYDYSDYHWPSGRPNSVKIEFKIDEDIDRDSLPANDELTSLLVKYTIRKSDRSPLSLEEKRVVQLIDEGRIRPLYIPDKSNSEPTITKSHERIGLRLPDLAATRRFSAKHFTKFACLDQETHLLYPIAISDNREWFHLKEISPGYPNAYQEMGLWLQFSLGVGFSEIIRSIDSVERQDGMYRVKATIDWFSQLEGTGSFKIDNSMVVRNADISFGTSRVTVETTEGYRATDQKFSCARNGHFVLYRGKGKDREFDVVLDSVDLAMSDEDFDKISTPKNDARFDKIDGHLVQVRWKAKPSRGPSFSNLTLFGLAAVVTGVFVFLFVRGRLWRRT